MSDYDQRVQNLHGDEDIRDVHALTSPYYPHSMATSDRASRGDFSNMSVTNSTLVLAGSSIASSTVENDGASNWDYGLHPSASPTRGDSTSVVTHVGREVAASVRNVKKEEVESKITAWKNAKISEINNRFKREDTIINGWENEQAQQSTLRMKKIEVKSMICTFIPLKNKFAVQISFKHILEKVLMIEYSLSKIHNLSLIEPQRSQDGQVE